jgi:hypothetical protein
LPDKSGNYKNLGGEGLPKYLKLKLKSKLNSLILLRRHFGKRTTTEQPAGIPRASSKAKGRQGGQAEWEGDHSRGGGT